jgi:hypothetical protein
VLRRRGRSHFQLASGRSARVAGKEDDMFVQKIFVAIPLIAGDITALGGIDGPVYPPPGSPGFACTDDGGWPSQAGGITWIYTGFDAVECARGLYYGKDASLHFAASLDGTVDGTDRMPFIGIGGASGNQAEWFGQTNIYVWDTWYQNYIPVTAYTRLRLTLTKADGTPIPLAVPASIDGTFPDGAHAAARITGDFRDHWVLEATEGGAWEPFDDFYNARQTPPPGHPYSGTGFDLGTAFYTSDACPADLADPAGVLDLSDIVAFVTGFTASDPSVDFAEPFGVHDLQDIVVFVAMFNSGCP